MKDITEKRTVVSQRVEDLPYCPVAGSQAIPCSRCGQAVWLTPASVPLIGRGGRMICLRCFAEVYEEGEILVTDETRRELESYFGRPFSAADIALRVAEIKREIEKSK